MITAATPTDADIIEVLGGQRFEGVAFTHAQARKLASYYGFDAALTAQQATATAAATEAAYETKLSAWKVKGRGRPPVRPLCSVGEIARWYQAGSDRNLLRCVREDGLRIMAMLSPFLQRGEDPVELVQRLCFEAGYDCPLDDWEALKRRTDDPE